MIMLQPSSYPNYYIFDCTAASAKLNYNNYYAIFHPRVLFNKKETQRNFTVKNREYLI